MQLVMQTTRAAARMPIQSTHPVMLRNHAGFPVKASFLKVSDRRKRVVGMPAALLASAIAQL
jgi:hypothetical protein